MNIPEKVKVAFKEYTVVQEANLHDECAELYGQVHYIPQLIQLNQGSSEEQKKATLIHECLHAIDEVYGIGLKEEQVERLANGLYMFICDNPNMFKDDKEVEA